MSYPGGKNGAGTYQRIINLMPPHRVYIEPFLGGGAIMRLKRPAIVNIGLDLAEYSIAAFEGERRRSPDPAMSAETSRTGDGRPTFRDSRIAKMPVLQRNALLADIASTNYESSEGARA